MAWYKPRSNGLMPSSEGGTNQSFRSLPLTGIRVSRQKYTDCHLMESELKQSWRSSELGGGWLSWAETHRETRTTFNYYRPIMFFFIFIGSFIELFIFVILYTRYFFIYFFHSIRIWWARVFTISSAISRIFFHTITRVNYLWQRLITSSFQEQTVPIKKNNMKNPWVGDKV